MVSANQTQMLTPRASRELRRSLPGPDDARMAARTDVGEPGGPCSGEHPLPTSPADRLGAQNVLSCVSCLFESMHERCCVPLLEHLMEL